MKILALDFETYLIDMERPWESPKPVSLAICSGDENILKLAGNYGNDIEVLLEEAFMLMFEHGYSWVWQNGFSFDMPLLWHYYPQFRSRLLRALDEGRIYDTLVRERLYDLSTTGEIRIKKGSYSLESMVKKYLGEDISSFKYGANIWRLRHCELDGMRAKDYPADAIEYDLKDVIWLKDVFLAQEKNRNERGYGSINTEALQIQSAFALQIAYQKGMCVNVERLKNLEATIDKKLEPLQKKLIEYGMAHIDKKGKFMKRQKEFIIYLKRLYPDFLQYTAPTKIHPNGQVRTDDTALAEFPIDPIIQLRQEMSLLEKYKNTYIKNIKRNNHRFYEKYDFLKETGRTSSFIQTMPREGEIRELFEPDIGYDFVIIDYAHIEADVMAQTYKDLGLGRGLADYLNKGHDYHALIGSAWYNANFRTNYTPQEFELKLKDEDEDRRNEAKKYRKKGKPGGLGLSGGIGPGTLQTTAKGQGVNLSDEDSIAVVRFAEKSVPGLVEFRGIWGAKEKGWLGNQKPIAKKKIGERTGKDGKKAAVFQDQYAYESYDGFYRMNTTYCALANGISMQTPAALGAKIAIWRTFKYLKEAEILEGREIGDLVLFVHDEIGFQVKKECSEGVARDLARLMCDGMQTVLKDIRITVEGGLAPLWSKDEAKSSVRFKAHQQPEGRFEYERL